MLKVLSHSRDDDSDIFGCDGGFVDRLNGLVCPITREVDPKSEVSEEAELASQLLELRGGSSTVAERGVSTGTYKSVTKIQNQLQLGNKLKEKGNMATTSERGSYGT